MRRTLNYRKQKEVLGAQKEYSAQEAIESIKKTAKTKFDSSIEAHFRLGVDPKKSEQQIRTTVSLPHGSGKSISVAVFAPLEKQKEAKDAGADIVGADELIEEIQKTNRCNFSVAVATPDMMKPLSKIAKILGPRGLMPSPKNETVTPDVKKIVSELKKGKITIKTDDTGNIHQIIGKISFPSEHLVENFQTLLEIIKKNKPSGIKGIFIQNITLCSTMSPGVKIAL